jgi:hypothetical protein
LQVLPSDDFEPDPPPPLTEREQTRNAFVEFIMAKLQSARRPDTAVEALQAALATLLRSWDSLPELSFGRREALIGAFVELEADPPESVLDVIEHKRFALAMKAASYLAYAWGEPFRRRNPFSDLSLDAVAHVAICANLLENHLLAEQLVQRSAARARFEPAELQTQSGKICPHFPSVTYARG